MASTASKVYRVYRGQGKPKKTTKLRNKEETKKENKAKLENDSQELRKLKFGSTEKHNCVNGYRCSIVMRFEEGIIERDTEEYFIGTGLTLDTALSIIHSKFIGKLGYRSLYAVLTNNENRYESVPILDDEIICKNNKQNIDNNYRNEIINVLKHLNRRYNGPLSSPFHPMLQIKREPIYLINNNEK